MDFSDFFHFKKTNLLHLKSLSECLNLSQTNTCTLIPLKIEAQVLVGFLRFKNVFRIFLKEYVFIGCDVDYTSFSTIKSPEHGLGINMGKN